MRIKIQDKILNPFSIIFILLFWMITFAIFFQKEIKPNITSYSDIGYRAIIPEDLLLEDEWKSIYFNDAKIGFSHTYLRLASEKDQGGYLMENTTMINMPLGILSTKLNFHSIVKLSSERKLENFQLDLDTNKYFTKVKGKRVAPDKIEITQETLGNTRTFLLEVPENLILSTFLEPASRFSNIKVNEKLTFNVFNPILMKCQEVNVYVKELKETPSGEFYILNCTYQNFTYTMWVNKLGQIVKEISPIGIKIIKVNHTEAVKHLNKIYRDVSIRDNFSIPVEFDYSDLEDVDRLKVRLKNIDTSALNLETSNQSIIGKNKDVVTLKIQKEKISTLIDYDIKDSDEINKYLKSTAFIQKNHPDIIDLSKNITLHFKEDKDADKVRAILNWIKLNIRQLPTFSIPSAVDVLRVKVGDCNEITYLFTALARASYIPAKIITGLVYLNNKFQYHMWANVFINGRWISVDPTLHQFPADVMHIGLIQGGYEHQLNLANIISRMEIEILEYDVKEF